MVADAPRGAVATNDVAWLIARLRTMVTSSRAVWAGRGMTLLQLVALQFISACSSGHGQWPGPRPGYETASYRGDRRSPSQCGVGAPLAGSPRPATDPGDHHLGCPTDCRRHRRRHRPTAICGSSCPQCTDPPATDRPGREHGAAWTGTGQDTTASSPTAESQPLSVSAEDSPSSEATAEA